MKLTNSIALLRPDWVAQYDRKAKEIFLEKEKVIEWILARFPGKRLTIGTLAKPQTL